MRDRLMAWGRRLRDPASWLPVLHQLGENLRGKCDVCGELGHQRDTDLLVCDHRHGIDRRERGDRKGKHEDLDARGCLLCGEERHRRGLDPKGRHRTFKVAWCPLCMAERHRRGIEEGWLSEGRHRDNSVQDCRLCNEGFHPGGMRVETGLAQGVERHYRSEAGQQHSDCYNDATQSGQRDARGP